MKKILMLLLVLVLLVGFAPRIKLMRLELVNKSAFPVWLVLNEVTLDQPAQFYLVVDAADVLPGVRVYTLPRGVYDVEASYCNQEFITLFQNLDLNISQFRVVIPPCDQAAVADAVSDGVLKLSPLLYPPVDLLDKPIIYNLGEFRWRY